VFTNTSYRCCKGGGQGEREGARGAGGEGGGGKCGAVPKSSAVGEKGGGCY